MPSFFDLQKYAATGIAAPEMTAFDKARALAAFGGGKTQTMTGVPPLTFKANGTPLISWSMLGNGQQTGTPTPDNPVMPEFVGALDSTDWAIPISCAGQTVPVYLGQAQTVRKIRKLVLTGTEDILRPTARVFRLPVSDAAKTSGKTVVCTHFSGVDNLESPSAYLGSNEICVSLSESIVASRIYVKSETISALDDFKSYLAQQYAAGHPVTVWYVLDNEQTGIVNEPLCKIGDYADELHSTDASVTIPTAKGQNTLTVDTDLQPSEMTIKYRE